MYSGFPYPSMYFFGTIGTSEKLLQVYVCILVWRRSHYTLSLARKMFFLQSFGARAVPNSKFDTPFKHRWSTTWRFYAFGAEIEIVAFISFSPPSSKTIELWQICYSLVSNI